jgi:quinol monooxygenase YgiN
MSEPIVYVDHSKIREGKLDALKAALNELATWVENAEPHLLSYNIYLDEDAGQMTVMHVHRDAESLDIHMELIGSRLSAFAGLITLLGIDIYGAPSALAMKRLAEKAETLGTGGVTVHELHAGFTRFA